VDKSPDAFRTISEVATELDLPQHVLRFWETRFSQIKPMKRGGGRRYYRPEDVELLCGIRHLLYGEGYTIKGVQRILKEQGVRFVMDTWHEAELAGETNGEQADDGEMARVADAAQPQKPAEVPAPHVIARKPEPAVAGAVTSERRTEPRPEPRTEPRMQAAAPAPSDDDIYEEPARVVAKAAQPKKRATADDAETSSFRGQDQDPVPRDVLADTPTVDGEHPAARGSFRFMERLRGEGRRDGPHEDAQKLAQDDIRRLQATLFELLECKRILDQAR
jgi:DNA-binding transcriptional MerR regulator